jgi:hypothetical protein
MMKDEMERHHKMMSKMMGPQRGEGMMMGPNERKTYLQESNSSSSIQYCLQKTILQCNVPILYYSCSIYSYL